MFLLKKRKPTLSRLLLFHQTVFVCWYLSFENTEPELLTTLYKLEVSFWKTRHCTYKWQSAVKFQAWPFFPLLHKKFGLWRKLVINFRKLFISYITQTEVSSIIYTDSSFPFFPRTSVNILPYLFTRETVTEVQLTEVLYKIAYLF